MSLDPGVWVAALLTLAIYSFLYKDNPFYKLAEHIFVGVSTGYLVVVTVNDSLRKEVYLRLRDADGWSDWLVLAPTLLGLLMFARLSSKYQWLSRWPIAFIVGATAGFAVPNVIQAQLLRQAHATMTPLWSPDRPWLDSVNAVLVLVGVLSVLVYFFFSVPHTGPLKPTARLGMIYMMLFFGASFGYTVMGRVSILIGRMDFLLRTWLGLG